MDRRVSNVAYTSLSLICSSRNVYLESPIMFFPDISDLYAKARSVPTPNKSAAFDANESGSERCPQTKVRIYFVNCQLSPKRNRASSMWPFRSVFAFCSSSTGRVEGLAWYQDQLDVL